MTGRRHAVLVASGRFPHEPRLQDLRGPENDVDVFHRLLRDTERGAFTECAVLKNCPHHEVLLRINQVVKSAGKDDLVLLYYSGHGKLDAAGRLHLATRDTTVDNLEATSIPVQSIRNYLDLTRSTRTLLILDCCFSGAVGEAFLRSGVDDQLQIFSRGRGTYLMSASTGLQVAREDIAEAHGAFTRHLLHGIESGEADLDADGLISIDELYAYVHEHMRDEGFQEPMKWDLNVKGELILSRCPARVARGAPPSPEERLHALAANDVLPTSVLRSAHELLSTPPVEGTAGDPDAERRALLAQLLEERMKVSDFIEQWYRLEVRPASPAKNPVYAPPSATVEPPTNESAPAVRGKGRRQRKGATVPNWDRPARRATWLSRKLLAGAGIAGAVATAVIAPGAMDAVERIGSAGVDWSRSGAASQSHSRVSSREPAEDRLAFSTWQHTQARVGPTEDMERTIVRYSSSEEAGLEESLGRDAYRETIEQYNRTAKQIIDSMGR